MIKSFIQKYILPKELDFISALEEQSLIVNKIASDLYLCFIEENANSCEAIISDEHQAKEIREKNMNELLDTFITPFDRESIYRVITQLDWIALSVRHFVLEAQAYKIRQLDATYADILKNIELQSSMLNVGFKNLKSSQKIVIRNTQDIRDSYEALTDTYIQRMAELSENQDKKDTFIQRELLAQLKEISKRMQMCANSLEDIVMKMS